MKHRIAIACVLTPALLAGCTGVDSLFSPEFLQSFGVSKSAADLPGEAPAVLVTVENATGRRIEYIVQWRDSQDDVKSRSGSLNVDASSAEVLVCPISEITLGDLSDHGATGAIVLLGNGGGTDAFMEVEPFGLVLEEGVHYECGDEVKFVVQTSSATLSGYQVFAFVTHAGVQSSAGDDPNSLGG